MRGLATTSSILSLTLVSCGGSTTESGDTAPPEMEHVFTFAQITDTHIYATTGENVDRTAAVVEWLNREREARGIELTIITGDIAWNDGLPVCAELFSRLEMDWVPIIGDNEGHSDDEGYYWDVFAPHYEHLDETLDDWRLAIAPIWDVERDEERFLVNFHFDYKGVRFVGLDWASRDPDPIEGEMGHLHDYSGGTLEFLGEALEGVEAAQENSVVMMTHIPMIVSPGGFDLNEMDTLLEIFNPIASKLALNLAGHFHANAELFDQADGAYTSLITDAVWDDEAAVRLIHVHSNGIEVEFEHELIDVDWEEILAEL